MKLYRNTYILFLVVNLLLITRIHAQELIINSGKTQWVFENRHGLLTEWRYIGQPKHTFVFSPPCPIWEIVGTPSNISPNDEVSFSFAEDDNSYTLKWNGIVKNVANQSIPYEVVILCKPIAFDSLEVSFRCSIPEYFIKEIIFPKVTHVTMDKSTHLVIPYWMGEIYDSDAYPDVKTGFVGNRTWEYPGVLSMQWIGLYNTAQHGMMLWIKDWQQNFKQAHIAGDGNKGCLEWKHLISSPITDYSLPYFVCLSSICGNWFDMALLYRDWARKQSWSVQSGKARGQTAPWVEQTALWIWNRMESDKVLVPAIDMAERLHLPVSVLWHWWHGCAYDTGFPEYLPPREGQEKFITSVHDAHHKGIHTLIYVNQRLWGMQTNSWKEKQAEQFAVLGNDGKLHPEVYNIFNKAPCVTMCMGTEFWRETLLKVMLSTWHDTPIDGYYLDQACSSLPCFATNHGHVPGGKNFWIQGFQHLVARLRENCQSTNSIYREKTDKVVLAGEGCGEAWLPFLDLFLSLQVSKDRYAGNDGWRAMPLFQAVYHPIAIQFGNYASLTEPPYDTLWPQEFAPKEPLKLLDTRWNTQFCYEQACAWAWGQQPMIANYKKELWTQRKDVLEFAIKLAKLHHQFREVFLNGEMLKPLTEHSSDTWEEICLSVYAYRKEGGKSFLRRGSLLITMPWYSSEGKVILAVANADRIARELKFTTSTKDWELGNDGIIIKHTVSDNFQIGTFNDGHIRFQQKIPSLDANLFEFKGVERN